MWCWCSGPMAAAFSLSSSAVKRTHGAVQPSAPLEWCAEPRVVGYSSPRCVQKINTRPPFYPGNFDPRDLCNGLGEGRPCCLRFGLVDTNSTSVK